MARQLALLALVLILASGCVRSRLTFEPMDAPAAEVSAFDVAAGDDLYPFRGLSGTWGYMEATGRVVLDPTYGTAEPFSEGRAKVRIGDTFGFIDPTGALVIPARYTSAEAFSQGRALVTEGIGKRMRYGFIDPSGAVVVPSILPVAYSFKEGRALIRFRDSNLTWFQRVFRGSGKESLGFIDLNGRVVFELPGEAASFSDGLAPFSKPEILSLGRWGYVRPDGSVAIPPTFRGTAFRFSEGLARVTQDGAFAFVDSTGQAAFSATYALARPFSEGRAAVQVEDHWGYVDETGVVVIEPQFDQAGPFSEGLAAVQLDGQWGYIDRDGQMAIGLTYRSAQAFRRGLAYVRDTTGPYYIDTSGQPIRPDLTPR